MALGKSALISCDGRPIIWIYKLIKMAVIECCKFNEIASTVYCLFHMDPPFLTQ
jgi:hypothetical protein